MSELRPFALVRDSDQWLRSSFSHTALDPSAGIIELARQPVEPTVAPVAPTRPSAGLAFDSHCRVYHSDPTEGRVERVSWRGSEVEQPRAIDLFAKEDDGDRFGDFGTNTVNQPVLEPRGLAVDVNDRLFVAEAGAQRILIYDLWSHRLLRQVVFSNARPVDLTTRGVTVYAVLQAPYSLVTLTARSGPRAFAVPPMCTEPSRIAVSPGGMIAILEKADTSEAHVWFVGDRQPGDFAVPGCTDLDWESDGVLVAALGSGSDFRRWQLGPGDQGNAERAPLRAPGYLGDGIVAMPETVSTSGGAARSASRRIGYWSASGFRSAIEARGDYLSIGRVTTLRLDSHEYQTTWGRLFVDACIPPGTDVRVHCATLDDDSDEETILRTPPSNFSHVIVDSPELSPPMPPLSIAPLPLTDLANTDRDEVAAQKLVCRRLHRRESGRELPWSGPGADDPFQTYETLINAAPGRYLWVTLELRGNRRRTPRIRCLRAEHPSHDYLKRLPRVFSRDARVAPFLQRYLAIFEGLLGELDARSTCRDLLLDPRCAPDEVLAWLASFVGLVLDERWERAPRPGGRTEDARRAAIQAAVWLFRFRGTVPGLKRFIEIYTGIPVAIIEHFRLRGLGGAILGDTGAVFSSSVLGGGFRVGGAVGEEGAAPLEGELDDAFRTHAHRFSVIVPSMLDAEQLDVVNHIIEVHRPAHTIFRVCTVDAGMRVGRGLHVSLSSLIGTTGGFATVQLGTTTLDRGSIIGRPEDGMVLGTSPLGDPSLFR